MIKKLTNTDGYKVIEDYGSKIIEKDGEDFAYCPLFMLIYANYEESEAEKLNDDLLIKEIKKYDNYAIKLDDKIYISEDDMADLIYEIDEDFGIKPMEGLI